MRKPLALIGMSGVGKSHAAKALADAGWLRLDCDGLIAERLGELVTIAPEEEPVHAVGRWMGMPWTPGYAEREGQYLSLEEVVTAACLDQALAQDGPVVIDTTGSVVHLPASLQARLQDTCDVVYLRAPDAWQDQMVARFLAEPKPVVWEGCFEAGDSDPLGALPTCYRQLLRMRDARYEQLAHRVLNAAHLWEAADAASLCSLLMQT